MEKVTDSESLFTILKKLNITAKQLADNTGISPGNISDWKNGRSHPSVGALNRINEFLKTYSENPELSIPNSDEQGILLHSHEFSRYFFAGIPELSEKELYEKGIRSLYYEKIYETVRSMSTTDLEKLLTIANALKK